MRSFVSVALRKDGGLHGNVTVYRQEVRPFSEKQIALLQNFAAQAVIAMENARLLGELRERTSDLEQSLEYQTATSDVLQVISRSTFDLNPVLDAVIHTAARLCQAEVGHIATRDGDVYRPLATFAVSPQERDAFIRTRVFKADNTTVVGHAVSEGKVIHVADVQTEPAYASSPVVVRSTGVRTILGVPLLRLGEPIGVLSLGRWRVEPFTERQIALVQTFADQAVIAIENARLLTETREALEQQTATAEVLQVINSSPGDLAPVFEVMLEKATGLCEARAGVLRSWDGECFHVSAVHGEPRFRDWVRQRSPTRPGGDDPLARITKGAGVVHFADPSDDPGYATSPDFRKAVELSGMRSGVTVPLRKDDALVGAITIYRQEVRPFTDKQIALLQSFAAQAVIAMENARLITETREALEQQTATAEV